MFNGKAVVQWTPTVKHKMARYIKVYKDGKPSDKPYARALKEGFCDL